MIRDKSSFWYVLICLLLVTLLILSIFAACGKKEDSDSTFPEITTPPTDTDISTPPSPETPSPEPPAITTTSLPEGDIGVFYSQTLATSGGIYPYKWSISAGALPDGLSLNSLTGTISGTPTTDYTYRFTVVVIDSRGSTTRKDISITINAAPAITTASLPGGGAGVSYSQTLVASRGTLPYNWSISAGSLPDGLSLNSSTGAISGTPTTIGKYAFTIQVIDNAGGIATQAFKMNINPAPIITTASLPIGEIGVYYSQTLAASSGTPPYNWSISAGSLPTGLMLISSAGAISGTPTTAGTYTFTVRVIDNQKGISTKHLSITIKAAPNITTASLPDGEVDVFYSQTVAVTDGTPPYTWSLSAGSLPTNLLLHSLTGAISGTATKAGNYSFTVQVTDHVGGIITKALSITIKIAPVIATASLPDGDVSVSYSQTLAAAGGIPPYRWSISEGSLPDGLSLNSSTGAISGTPTTISKYAFTVQVTDSAGVTGSRALSITINPLLTITTASLSAGEIGVLYSQTLAASSGTSPYTWSISAGSLPIGLSLDSSTGAISGTPTTAVKYAFTVKVTDKAGGTTIKALSIVIIAAPAITTVSLPVGEVGVFYSETLAASGGFSPYRWSISEGSLPVGLSLDSSTGVISGTPTTAGLYIFDVQLTDSAGVTATRALYISIQP